MSIHRGNHWNGSVEENIFSSGGIRMMIGNIEQAMITQSTAPLPLNVSRASAYAATMPNSRVRIVVVPDTISELISDRPKLFWPEKTPLKFSTETGLGMNCVLRPWLGSRSEETIIQ